jgi:transposase
MPLPRRKPGRISRPRRSKASKWVQLEEKIEALEGDWHYGEIIDLLGWKTIKYKELDHDIIVMAELTTGPDGTCKCPPSETELKKSGFTDPYHVQDIESRGKRFRIYYRLQRWHCKRCKNSAQQTLPEVDSRHQMTSRLVRYVEQESFDLFRSFSDVADEVGCSEQTVRNIFTRRAKQLGDEANALHRAGLYEPPEWLAIDEVHPQKKVEYCVISAPALRKVLDILPVNREKELFKWLLRLRPNEDRVKVVTMDMCLEYRSLVRKLLPKAVIVVDRYHVHNLLNVAIKEVLDVVRASMTYTQAREKMRPEHLLLTSYRKLSGKKEVDEKGVEQPSPKELADGWLAEVPDLARAHRLKEDFSDILQLYDRGKAEALTDEWLRRVHDFVQYFRGKYRRSHQGEWPDPFGNVTGTITQWRDSILNYIDCKARFDSQTVSNWFAEFANGRIKEAYHVGHHYSHEVLRLKCVHGGVLVRRRPPHPLDPPRLRVVRNRHPRGRKGKKPNPNANLEVLRRTRLERDDTRGLLPRPEEHPGFASRFNKEELERARQMNAEPAAEEAVAEPELAIQTPTVASTDESERPPAAVDGLERHSKFNPDQLKLF